MEKITKKAFIAALSTTSYFVGVIRNKENDVAGNIIAGIDPFTVSDCCARRTCTKANNYQMKFSDGSGDSTLAFNQIGKYEYFRNNDFYICKHSGKYSDGVPYSSYMVYMVA